MPFDRTSLCTKTNHTVLHLAKIRTISHDIVEGVRKMYRDHVLQSVARKQKIDSNGPAAA